MLRNYLKIAVRNLWRNKVFSLINVLGLGIGMGTCLLIGLYVLDELGYDRFHEKADRIVRVVLHKSENNVEVRWPIVGPAMAQALQEEYPEVLAATRLRPYGKPTVRYGDKTFKENRFALADSNFFQVFSIPFVQGNPATALTDPSSVVLSAETARKYFGEEDPLGKVLELWERPFRVTGVFAEIPRKSHFHFDMLIPLRNLSASQINSWFYFEYYTYLVLPEQYDHRLLEAKLPLALEKHMGPEVQEFFGESLAQLRQRGADYGFSLQPLTDIHLHSNLPFELGPNGDIRYVYTFAAVALFMLLIACINFMNLSTAGAARRAKEVGVRKVLGSVRGQLVGQFLTESMLVTALALGLGVVLMELLVPFFNQLSGKELDPGLMGHPLFLPGLLVFGALVGLLAGSYPAFYLASFRPVAVLKNRQVSGKESVRLRSALVVVQFFVSVTLIVCTAGVYQQLGYLQEAKLGYGKEQVVVLENTHQLGANEAIFRERLLENPRVSQATVSSFIPAGPTNGGNEILRIEGDPGASLAAGIYRIDEDYLPTLGLQLVEGRNFSSRFVTDSVAVLVNETLARYLGGAAAAVGKNLLIASGPDGEYTAFRVAGVVGDFHFEPLHQKIRPLVMFLGGSSGNILVKAQTRDLSAVLVSLRQEWEAFSPGAPLSYSFLDDRFAATYEAERRVGQTLGAFAGLTVFIACLGLFGLAIFTAERRTKEIGIRKVLGATVQDIALLLSKDFLRLVLLAIVLAVPVAWYAMHRWLENFAYRIDQSLWVFAGAGLATLLVAFCTISFQAVKAALANPVKNLKRE